MKILVTGGTGFIGSNFVRYIYRVRPNWDITVFDKITYAGNLANIEGLDSSRVHFIKADICNQKATNDAVALADAVIHFAAESYNDNSLNDPSPFIQTEARYLESSKK